MPKYQKTNMYLHYSVDQWQDSEGAHHPKKPILRGSLWGHFAGRDFKEEFAIGAAWVKAAGSITVTRPSWGVTVGDHLIATDGTKYRISAINQLSGRIGQDMKLAVEEDANFSTD